jgi:hypothetical protein
VNIDEETKRKIIDLRIQQKKKIREIVSEVGKSSRDITIVLREHVIQQGQTTMDDKGKDGSAQDYLLPNVKAYKLFDEGKDPLEIAAELNLPGLQVQQFYVEYLNMRRMHKLVIIYQEIQDSIGYFLKLFRLGKEKGVTPEQIIKLVQMADSIHKLQDKLRNIEGKVLDISRRKSVDLERLKDLHDETEAAQEKLNLINKTFEVKYEELKEVMFPSTKATELC